MRSCMRCLGARVLVLLACLAGPAVASPPSLEAYGRLPSIEFAALSPDGSRVALLRALPDGRVLVIFSLDQHKSIGGLKLRDQVVRGIDWADNDHVLMTVASHEMPFELTGEKTEFRLIDSFDVTKNTQRGLLEHHPADLQTMNVIFRHPVVRRSGGETSVFLHGFVVQHRTIPALFRADLSSGREQMLREGSEATVRWLVDGSGEVVAEQDYADGPRKWTIRVMERGHAPLTVSGVADIDYPHLLGIDAVSGDLIASVPTESGSIWRILKRDGSWGEDVAPDEQATDIVYEAGSDRIIGWAYLADDARYHFTEPALQKTWDWVTGLFPNERVELETLSDDHSHLLVRVFGLTSGYSLAVIDAKARRVVRLGDVYQDVKEIAEVRRLVYPAADGLKIPAYVTLPRERAAKNLPLVVLPHGGPAGHDRADFDWWAQAIASRGYAVLQPNFRGSDLDAQWQEKGYGEFGRKMQTDVSDGVAYLAAAGLIDPKRVCIVGASYGGYAALAGVTLESGIYRCAVAFAPVSDPASMLAWTVRDTGGKLSLRYWDRYMGVRGADDPGLDAISPLKHADRVTVPVLLIHGKDDSTVPYEQSADMAKALKKANKSFEFVTLRSEDHYLSRSDTRLQMLTTTVNFLVKHNPPD
jgi:dienelactone hydrolase